MNLEKEFDALGEVLVLQNINGELNRKIYVSQDWGKNAQKLFATIAKYLKMPKS